MAQPARQGSSPIPLARAACSASLPKRPKRERRRPDDGRRRDEVGVEKKPARPDTSTYLSMYFRDMAVLDVLRPEEEFTSAREIEALEIMLWEAVLVVRAGASTASSTRSRRVPDFEVPAEAKTLRRLASGREPRRTTRPSARAAQQAARRRQRSSVHRRRARRDRSHDARHRRARRARAARSAQRAKVAEWLRRVQQANRAAADARNDFVKANLRLVVVDRAPLQPRPHGARRPDPGGQPRPHQGRRALRLHAAASGSRRTRAGGSATRSAARSPTRAARSGCRCT